ncbi:hypothetical protein PTKIN_Ptkin05aG0208000 [Pterospermum kingtungense]
MYAMLQLDMLQEENDNLLAKVASLGEGVLSMEATLLRKEAALHQREAYVHEYWSSLALLPFEVVVSAGQKAKEEAWDTGSKHCLFEKCLKNYPSLW